MRRTTGYSSSCLQCTFETPCVWPLSTFFAYYRNSRLWNSPPVHDSPSTYNPHIFKHIVAHIHLLSFHIQFRARELNLYTGQNISASLLLLYNYHMHHNLLFLNSRRKYYIHSSVCVHVLPHNLPEKKFQLFRSMDGVEWSGFLMLYTMVFVYGTTYIYMIRNYYMHIRMCDFEKFDRISSVQV